MLNIILFGPPGSGKGTQAKMLVEHYHLQHISTGDLFRNEMQKETALGLEAKAYMARGELVPDSVTIGMLKNAVDANPEAGGFILDGFPRTIPQAEALDRLFLERGHDIAGLVALTVSEEEIIQRILLRGKTSGRPDDNDSTVIRNRIQVYEEETARVYDYYAAVGKSHRVNGLGSVEEIFERLCAVIDGLDSDWWDEEE
jgi:adenylate kinase